MSTLSISCCYCNAQCFLNLNKWNEKIIWLISHFTKNHRMESVAILKNVECILFSKKLCQFLATQCVSCDTFLLPLTKFSPFVLVFFLIFKTRNHKYQGQKLNHHGRKILTFIITDFSTNCSLSSCKFNPCYRKTSCNLEKETFTIFFQNFSTE